MQPIDGRSLVPEGRAGTGAAFVLDETRNPLQVGLALNRQQLSADAAAAKQRAAQQAAADKTAQAKEKDLKDLLALDTSQAWDVDQPGITKGYDELVGYTQQQLAAGKNPADPRNAEQYGEFQRRRKDLQSQVASSMQQAERFKTLANLMGSDKDGYLDREAVSQQLQAYKAATPQERALMQLDPKRFIDVGKGLAASAADFDQQETHTRTITDSHGSTHETRDVNWTPAQKIAIMDSALQKQGFSERLQQEYEKLPAALRVGKAASFDSWKYQRLGTMVDELEGKKHEDLRTQGGIGVFKPDRPDAASLRYQREAEDNKKSVTTAFNEAKGLFDGNPQVFNQPSRDYKGLYESTAYNGMALGGTKVQQKDEKGKYSEVENRVLGVFHDYDNGKTYIKTTASAQDADPRKQLLEVTESNAGQQLLRPIFGKNGGKGDVVDRLLTDNGLADGQGRVRFGARAADFDQAGYDARKGQGKLYQQRQERTVATLREDFTKWADKDAGPTRIKPIREKLQQGTIRLPADPGSESDTATEARNVQVDFYRGGLLSGEDHVKVSYDQVQPDGTTRHVRDQKLSKQEFQDALDTYQLDPTGASAPVQRSSGPAPANTTTVKTGSGKSKSSGSSQRGPATSASEATKANAAAGTSTPHLKNKFTW